MNFILKILVESILSRPGALIRWFFVRKEQTLKDVLLTYKWIDLFISSCLLAIAIVLYEYVLKK
jgi:hypothetical protein